MNPVNRLPDCYRKDSDSNNYKLLNINAETFDKLRKDIGTVLSVLDINQATGKTLDLYGAMLGQHRGLLNDTQYRYMLFARIGRNVVQGDYKSIMRALVIMFDSEQGEIALEDMEMEEEAQACVVKLNKFPLFVLVNAGFSSRQAVTMIETLLPICVTLYADNFEGTFEFAMLDNEYDEKAGFANIEQTIGGYLGLILGEDEKIPVLPL